MANKISRSSKTGRSSNVISGRRSSSSGSWLKRFRHRKAVIGAVFVLAFGGLGSWYIALSHAATPTPCVEYKLYEGSPLKTCVKNLQYILQKTNSGSTCPTGYCDGIFGPVTRSAVVRYGYYRNISNNGQVGYWTWRSICASSIAYPAAARAEGCGTVPISDYGRYN